MKYNYYTILAAIVCISLSSCKTEKKEKHPDVSQIEVDFDIIRLDEAVFAMDTNKLNYELDVLMDKYPSAATLYFGTLNPYTASRNRDTIASRLGTFLRDPFFQNLQDTIGLIYGDMSDVKAEYTQAYQYFNHYFPEADIANVYMMNTGFSYQRFLFQDDDESNALGVSLDIEYTTDQMKWVKENELQMWAYFFDQELFYETNTMTLKKYLSPNPNSPGMPAEAPGRTGNYIGWQIVKKYMKRFPKTTMQDLVALNDAQKILEESRYKPR